MRGGGEGGEGGRAREGGIRREEEVVVRGEGEEGGGE